MRVWFHPVDEPGIYAVDRTDPENPIFIISDGLPVAVAAACAARYATVEERDWVRAHIGSPTVAEDPSYTHLDRVCRGEGLWDRSMIPAGLLWEGKSPCPKPGGDVGAVALVWWAAAAAIVGVVASEINGTSGFFNQLPVM